MTNTCPQCGFVHPTPERPDVTRAVDHAERMLSDRSKLPQGYTAAQGEVWSPDWWLLLDTPPRENEASAIADAWTHRDAIAAEVRRETLEEAARLVCGNCRQWGGPDGAYHPWKTDAGVQHMTACPAAPLWRELAEDDAKAQIQDGTKDEGDDQ